MDARFRAAMERELLATRPASFRGSVLIFFYRERMNLGNSQPPVFDFLFCFHAGNMNIGNRKLGADRNNPTAQAPWGLRIFR
jgi:hypothetical protein